MQFTYSHIKIQLNTGQRYGEKNIKKIDIKLLCLYLVQHMLHQMKAHQFMLI